MTMSRGIFTASFITKFQKSMIPNQFNQFLPSDRGLFKDIEAIAELGHNEITSTRLLLLFSLCTFFISFDDFLLLGSLSLCTKTPIHGQNINTNIL